MERTDIVYVKDLYLVLSPINPLLKNTMLDRPSPCTGMDKRERLVPLEIHEKGGVIINARPLFINLCLFPKGERGGEKLATRN
jgi:hypothetical protein